MQLTRAIKEKELDKEGNTRLIFVPESNKDIMYYNLNIIISVGYRVKSPEGTQFRIWATKILREYLIKGFAINDARLANEANSKDSYFEELLERVRAIRTSEKHFYLKVIDIFATSIDYDSKSQIARDFFAAVQNKFHYAVHGHTAAELIVERVDAEKENMGLTSWKGNKITQDDAIIAKNYLEALELKKLRLLVEQFLSHAELEAVEHRVMTMAQWAQRLDDFLRFNNRQVLQGKGKVSHQDMKARVGQELSKYEQKLALEGIKKLNLQKNVEKGQKQLTIPKMIRVQCSK